MQVIDSKSVTQNSTINICKKFQSDRMLKSPHALLMHLPFTSRICIQHILALCTVNKRGRIPQGHVHRTPLDTLASLPSIVTQYVYVFVSAGPLASRDCYEFLLVCLPGCMLRFNLYKITIRCAVLSKGIRSDSLLAITTSLASFISTPSSQHQDNNSRKNIEYISNSDILFYT